MPARFPLLKRLMDKAEAQRRKGIGIDSLMKAHPEIKPVQETDEMTLDRFTDAGWECTWKQALLVLGPDNCLTDEAGRPLNRWAARLIVKAKKAHACARREYLADRAGQRAWSGITAATSTTTP